MNWLMVRSAFSAAFHLALLEGQRHCDFHQQQETSGENRGPEDVEDALHVR